MSKFVQQLEKLANKFERKIIKQSQDDQDKMSREQSGMDVQVGQRSQEKQQVSESLKRLSEQLKSTIGAALPEQLKKMNLLGKKFEIHLHYDLDQDNYLYVTEFGSSTQSTDLNVQKLNQIIKQYSTIFKNFVPGRAATKGSIKIADIETDGKLTLKSDFVSAQREDSFGRMQQGVQSTQEISRQKRKMMTQPETTDLESVKKYQTLLKQKGFDPGVIDGKIGPNTRRAIKNFQEARRLPVTQRLDRTTINQLDDDINMF